MLLPTNVVVATIGILTCLADAQFAFFDDTSQSGALGNYSLEVRDDVAPGIELRILPLGASITYGQGSTDGNGFRNDLLKELSGTKVQYIGSLRNGDMADNFNEGHSGFTIEDYSETVDQAKKSLGARPNLILLHAGTNDLDRNPASSDPSESGAPDRLGKLIDVIVNACPDATLLVAQIISAADPRVASKIKTFNAAIPDVVAQRTKQGHQVMAVDMSDIGDGFLISDGIHPNDIGYQRMADHWYQAIKKIPGGWLKAPIGPDPHPFVADNAPGHPGCLAGRDLTALESRATKTGHHCLGLPIWTSLGRISHGVGTNGPAAFHQKWTNRGRVTDGFGKDGLNVIFADLRGKGKADYLWVDPKTYEMHAWLNDGVDPKFKWTDAGIVAKLGCHLDHLRLPNLSGSGLADYVCIDIKTGAVNAWFNKWSVLGGWKWDGPHRISDPRPGGNINSIFFMDINGDSRDDMVVRGPKGELHGFLSIGKKTDHTIDTHPSGTTTYSTTFADLNNDGRDDIVVRADNGALSGYLNVRDFQEGQPVWTHQDNIKDSVGILKQDTRIAELTGNGWADYILVNNKNGALTLYANNGDTDVSRIGDGTWVADMNGDGLDDKILMTEDGRFSVWLNGQANPKANYGWNLYGQRKGDAPVNPGHGTKREYIRLADMDGDGKADILSIDENTGAISCWLNTGPSKDPNNAWYWNPMGVISPSVGDSIGIQFADVTGDGKADLIYLDINSHMTVHRNEHQNNAKGWAWTTLNAEPIDFNAGFRRDMRFADIDGDQKADAIWIHPQDGSAVVWLSKDPSNRAGWVRASAFPATQIPGRQISAANIQFGRIATPYGRADYIQTDPSTGAWTVWRNDCDKLESGTKGEDTSNNQNPGGASGANSASGSGSSGGSSGSGGSGGSSGSSGSSGGNAGSASSGVAVCGEPEPTTYALGGSGPASSNAPGGANGGSSAASPAPTGEVIVFGGSAYTENGNTQFIIAGQTLTPGGEITVQGTPISLASGGTVAVIGGSTQQLSPTNAVGGLNPADSGVAEILMVGGSTYIGNAGSGFVIDGQTLKPGGQITVAGGTPVSLAPGGLVAIVAGSTESLLATITGKPTIVIDGTTFTANSASQFVINGQTLTPNGQITVSGTPISLDEGASTAVIGGHTTPIFDPHFHTFSFSPPPESSSSSDNNGDSGELYGITVPGLVTIASASHIDGFDRSGGPKGGSALDALKSHAKHGLSLFGDALNALRGLSFHLDVDGFPSANDLQTAANLFSQAVEEIGSCAQALESIELTDFSDALKPQVIDIQTGIRNLFGSLRGGIGDLWRHKRSYGAILALFGGASYLRSLTDLINFGSNNQPVQNSATPTESQSTSQCTKSVVTDHWVSCASASGSSSCTTTSSSTASGCDVTATTTTTTGDSCPVITLDPNDDEGEDGDMGGVSSRTSSAPAKTSPPAVTITTPLSDLSSLVSRTESKALPPATTVTTPLSDLSSLVSGTHSNPPPSSPSSTPPPSSVSTSVPQPAPAPSSSSDQGPPLGPQQTAPPPSSAPIFYNFYLGYWEDCTPGGGGALGGGAKGSKCSSSYSIYALHRDDNFDPCNAESVRVYEDEVPGAVDQYPLTRGAFDGGGQTGCTFDQQDPNSPGTLTCKGNTVTCTQDGAHLNDCNNARVIWHPLQICTM